MRLEKTQNTIRNMFFGVITRVIQILFPFVIRTAFIYTLGVEYLGLNSLFSSILSVLSLTELGISSALVFSMYKPLAEGDTETVCALMNLYRKCYYTIGCVIALLGTALLPFLPNLIKGDLPPDVNIYVLYGINLLSTVISYFLFAYKNCILEVHQRNDITSKIVLLMSFIQYGVQTAVLIFVRNYYAFLVVSPIISISRNIITSLIVDKKYPQFKARGKVEPAIISGIKKRISALVLYKIGGIVLNSVDNIVISAFLGLSILAIYNNYYYLLTALFGFLAIIVQSMLAGVGNSVVTDTIEKNYQDFNKFLFMQLWIVSWCAITLFCLYQPFMYLWVGEKLMFPTFTAFLMVLLFSSWRIGDIVGLYKEALGMWYEDRFRPLIGAVVNLSTNLILVQFIGIDGVILSSIICIVLITFPIAANTLFKNYFKRSPMVFYAKQLRHFLVTGVCGAATYACCEWIGGNTIGTFILKMAVCVVVPNLMMIVIYHRNPEFVKSKEFAISVVRRMKK